MNQKKKRASLRRNFRRLLKIRVLDSEPIAVKDKVSVQPPQKKVEEPSITPVSISIKAAMSRGIQNKPIAVPKKEVQQDNFEEVGEQDKAYTVELVVEKLKEYSIVRKKSERVVLAIANCEPEIQEDGKLIIKVGNQIQLDDILAVKNEIVNYLRRELKNSTIDFTMEIIQNVTKKKLYSDMERFKYLCSKNPLIEQLKQKFSLDFE